MPLVQDLLDRLKQLQSDRIIWEQHWFDVATYALPDAERFDNMFATGNRVSAFDSIVSEPVASQRGRDIYDMTSLWAIDRGAAGTIALTTPQQGTWHDLTTDDPFGADPTDDEDRFYEQLRDFLFATRANPVSGFWMAHKAAMRALWGLGTSVIYVEEGKAGRSSPISYRYVPLSENHLAVNDEGVVDTNYRLFNRSARQCVQKWGDRCSAKTQQMADNPKERDRSVLILHAVQPREEKGSYGNTNRESAFGSCYVEVNEKHLIGESGYWEFPFTVHHWQRNNPGPYAEGPISLALADIKSLNLLSMEQMRAVQQYTAPPTATIDDTGGRVNLNPRANNPGYLGQNGEILVKPIITAQRPDFTQAILEAKRNQVRETLYVNLWQILIQNPQMTATEAMIRANEKGDLLGPVGTSIQTGLSHTVDREIGILARRGAFESGSPLAPPESLQGRDIGVRFTSPLDKLRRIPQLQGISQLSTLAATIAQIKPEVLDKFDWDAMIDEAQDILDAPMSILVPDDVLAERRQQRQMQDQLAQGTEAARAAGEAGEQAAVGAQAVADNPAASEILKRIAGITGMAQT